MADPKRMVALGVPPVLANEIAKQITEADGGPTSVTTAQISDATTLGRSVMTAADQAAARTAIGAGTSNLALGTTASTAKAGNYTPTSAEVSTALKAKSQIAALVSPSADYASLTAATAAIKSIIDALKA
ncbi:MAG TPA: hypothetical protein VN150_12280 [Ochrobactrum sp.]|nr:hypothetical protein [Ochrobactrum sp.]